MAEFKYGHRINAVQARINLLENTLDRLALEMASIEMSLFCRVMIDRWLGTMQMINESIRASLELCVAPVRS